MKQIKIEKQSKRPAPADSEDHRSPSGRITWRV